MTRRQYRKPHLIAHRGWSHRFPENSFPAFSSAIAAGAHELELDVRVSVDGVPFVIHDSTIDRTTDGTGKVAELTADELRQVSLKDLSGEVIPGLGIPTLPEVLANFVRKVGLNIHIKGMDARCTPLHMIDSLAPFEYQPFYIAGDRGVLEEALEICPHIPRCLIQGRKDTDVELVFQTAQELLCERIQFFKGYFEDKDLQTCLERGFITNLYWVDEPSEAEAAILKGVLGLLTNDIGLVYQHLAELDLVR